MSFTELVHAITAPDTDQLITDLKHLDDKIEDVDTSLQEAIHRLREKIDNDNIDNDISPTKRNLFAQQIEELQKIYNLYKQSRDKIYTQATKEKLAVLFRGIPGHISDTTNSLPSNTEKIARIIENEEQKLKDTFFKKTIRDQVESYTNFLGDWERLKETPEITQFLHRFTVEYLNRVPTPQSDKGLDINENILNSILTTLGAEIFSHFQLEFTLRDGQKIKKNSLEYTKEYISYKEYDEMAHKIHILGLYPQYEKKKFTNIKDINTLNLTFNQLKQDYTEVIKTYQVTKGLFPTRSSPGAGNINDSLTTQNIDLALQVYKDAQETFRGTISTKLLQEERKEEFIIGEFIATNGLPEDSQKLIFDLIKKYGVIQDIENKTEEEKNKILTRVAIFLRFLLSIESQKPFKKSKEGGYKYAKNTDWVGWEKGTTAKGAFQFMDGYKGNQLSKEYNLHSKFSPFFTALRSMNKYYSGGPLDHTFTSQEIPKYIKIAYKNPGKISPLDFTSEQSINMCIINLFTTIGTNKLLRWILIDAKPLAMEKLYKKAHYCAQTDNRTNYVVAEKLKLSGKILRNTL